MMSKFSPQIVAMHKRIKQLEKEIEELRVEAKEKRLLTFLIDNHK
jgi:hypothetical protein